MPGRAKPHTHSRRCGQPHSHKPAPERNTQSNRHGNSPAHRRDGPAGPVKHPYTHRNAQPHSNEHLLAIPVGDVHSFRYGDADTPPPDSYAQHNADAHHYANAPPERDAHPSLHANAPADRCRVRGRGQHPANRA